MSLRCRFFPTQALVAAVALTFSAVSCSARYDLTLRADDSADVTLSASLESRTARLVTNLAALGGSGETSSPAPLLDADALSRSLLASPGVFAAALRNPDARSVAGTVLVDDFENFLSAPAAEGSLTAARFVRLERAASGGRLSVSLDRASGATLLANLSPDIVDYVSALLAPVATGEALGRREYLDLVKSMYGAGIAEEMETATVRASIELPGIATAVRGGTKAGRRVDFSVPLVDLLVLEKPIVLEAVWE